MENEANTIHLFREHGIVLFLIGSLVILGLLILVFRLANGWSGKKRKDSVKK